MRIFQFEYMHIARDKELGKWVTKKFSLIELKGIPDKWQTALCEKARNSRDMT
jgi:hypothetical protein